MVVVIEWDNIVQTNGKPMQIVANRRGRSAHMGTFFAGLVVPDDRTKGCALEVCMAFS